MQARIPHLKKIVSFVRAGLVAEPNVLIYCIYCLRLRRKIKLGCSVEDKWVWMKIVQILEGYEEVNFELMLVKKCNLAFWAEVWTCTATRTGLFGLQDVFCATTLAFHLGSDFHIFFCMVKPCDPDSILESFGDGSSLSSAQYSQKLKRTDRECPTYASTTIFEKAVVELVVLNLDWRKWGVFLPDPKRWWNALG